MLVKKDTKDFEKHLKTLSEQELRELVMINAYKVELARKQLDAIVEILIKKKITTYEQLWKLTHEGFNKLNEE